MILEQWVQQEIMMFNVSCNASMCVKYAKKLKNNHVSSMKILERPTDYKQSWNDHSKQNSKLKHFSIFTPVWFFRLATDGNKEESLRETINGSDICSKTNNNYKLHKFIQEYWLTVTYWWLIYQTFGKCCEV